MIFTTLNPMIMARTVVTMYSAMVFPPIRDNFVVSFKLVTPTTSEANTNGMAINLRRVIKIVPNGRTYSDVNSLNPLTLETNPQMSPRTRPIMICQCNFLYHCMRLLLRGFIHKFIFGSGLNLGCIFRPIKDGVNHQ